MTSGSYPQGQAIQFIAPNHLPIHLPILPILIDTLFLIEYTPSEIKVLHLLPIWVPKIFTKDLFGLTIGSRGKNFPMPPPLRRSLSFPRRLLKEISIL
jgi:hypothetical protein